MRILHVMASGARGGGLDHLLGLLPALSEIGFTCDAAIGKDGPGGELLRVAGVPVVYVDLMGSRLDPRAPLAVHKAIRRARPDLVHFHGTRAGFFGAVGWPALRVAGPLPKAIYTAHGLSYRKEIPAAEERIFRGVEALICRTVDHVISVSLPDLDELIQRGYVAAADASWVPNAVDIARFTDGNRDEARRRIGVAPPDSAFVVGTVSRLVPQKAVADLIAALERCPLVTGVVVGDGSEADALRARGASLGARLRWLGDRDDVAELLPGFDLFALASHWEGEPIALLEAMAAGLACVATATPATEMLLAAKDGDDPAGIVVPIGDVAALAAAIETLRNDPDRRGALGAAAQRAVAGRTYVAAAAAVADIYRAADTDHEP